MYCYEDITPTDLLDLHCKAVLGIEKGIVDLPKFKTLKLGLQIDRTDLYCTVLSSSCTHCGFPARDMQRL